LHIFLLRRRKNQKQGHLKEHDDEERETLLIGKKDMRSPQ
jgi:hypothetical protein